MPEPPAASPPPVSEPAASDRVLMVRPARFGFNPETAASNVFQNRGAEAEETGRRARREFDAAAGRLAAAGLEVLVWDDRPEPPKPDAIFPNNWLSTHGDGTLVLYPLEARNRRLERDPALLAWLRERLATTRVLDLSGYEEEGAYLEGTGSLVLDRPGRVAYCALSSRSHPRVLARWAEAMGYTVVTFRTDDGHGRPVYHTNVVMALGEGFACVVEEAVTDPAERARLRASLESSGREVLALTREEMRAFGANALAVRGRAGPLWVVSERAWAALAAAVRRRIERAAGVLPLDVRTIEEVGGGGIRCMLAEIFPPQASPSGGGRSASR